MATSKRHQRPPIINPYDKFSQPDFDDWIGDLTGRLRSALGFEYQTERPQSSLADAFDTDDGSDTPHRAARSREVADHLSDAESAEELRPRSIKAKGKQRDPRERPNYGASTEPINLVDSDEERSSLESSGREGSRSEESGDSYDEESEGEEDDDTARHDRDWSQYASSSRNVVHAGSVSGESADGEDGSQADEHDERADDATVARSLSQFEDDEQPVDDDTSFPPPRLPTGPATRLAPATAPDIVDPWQGAEAYAEDYYKGGDRAIVKQLATSPDRLEDAEEAWEDAPKDDYEEWERPGDMDERSPEHDDVARSPVVDVPSGDRDVEIRDPWNPALAYAEDLYTGGDGPLTHSEDLADISRMGPDDVDMAAATQSWEEFQQDLAGSDALCDEGVLPPDQLSPTSPDIPAVAEDDILPMSDEEDRHAHVEEDGPRSPTPQALAQSVSAAYPPELGRHAGSQISSRSPSPGLGTQPLETSLLSPRAEHGERDFSIRSSPTPQNATDAPQAVGVADAAPTADLESGMAASAVQPPPSTSLVQDGLLQSNDTTDPLVDFQAYAGDQFDAWSSLSMKPSEGSLPEPDSGMSILGEPASQGQLETPGEMSLQATIAGMDATNVLDAYNILLDAFQDESVGPYADMADQPLSQSHSIAELEAELGFHPSSPPTTTGPLRQEDVHIIEVDDDADERDALRSTPTPAIEQPSVEAPPAADEVDAHGEIDPDDADAAVEEDMKHIDDAPVPLPATVEAPEESYADEEPLRPTQAADADVRPSGDVEESLPTQGTAGSPDMELQATQSAVALPDSTFSSPVRASPMGVPMMRIQIPAMVDNPYPASLSAPSGLPQDDPSSEDGEDDESTTGEAGSGDSSFASTDSAESATAEAVSSQEPTYDEGVRAADMPTEPSQPDVDVGTHSQPDVEGADKVDVEIAEKADDMVAIPAPAEEEPLSIAEIVEATSSPQETVPLPEATSRSGSPTPRPQPQSTEANEVTAEESIDGKTDSVDQLDAQTPEAMPAATSDVESDTIKVAEAPTKSPSLSPPQLEDPAPPSQNLAPDAASHDRGPTPDAVASSSEAAAIPSEPEKALPQKRARSMSETSSLTESDEDSEEEWRPPKRKRDTGAPPRLRKRAPQKAETKRPAARRAKRAKREDDDFNATSDDDEGSDYSEAAPRTKKKPSKGKERATTPSTASTSGASVAARMLEEPSSRASSVDPFTSGRATSVGQHSVPPPALPPPSAVPPVGAAWNMTHQHRKAAPTTMFQQIQRRMTAGAPPPAPRHLSSAASASSAPPSDGSGSSASSASASASAPPRRTKSARTLAVAASTTRAVTRANCRYHKVSIPREENQQRFYFLVPGCSLGHSELIEEEDIQEHGLASWEDGVRGIKDVEQLDLDPYVVGNLRKLTGVDILREGEVYYLPAPGETVRIARARPSLSARDYAPGAGGSQPSSPLHQHYARSPMRKAPTSVAESIGSAASGEPVLQRGRTATPSAYEDDDDELTEIEDEEDEPQRSTTGSPTKKGKGKAPDSPESSKKSAPRRRPTRLGEDLAAYKPGGEEQEVSTEDEEEETKRRKDARRPRKSGAARSGAARRGDAKRGVKRTRTSEVGAAADDNKAEGPSKSKKLRTRATAS
ncbi:hypothetical protein BD626DRAFT_532921 [Schizophyllum amplum]|uniref:Uncharacterized protein n=1 Tax=Schizophyllum amplum TaxID=97359 RepID=A0A550CWF6_9AGAR|nr:hypothetical protein BD626DRAFT_532921 [Auriculariopsis ampla]